MEEENNVCADCGYEGPEGPGESMCPTCAGEMIPSKEKGKTGIEEVSEEEEL